MLAVGRREIHHLYLSSLIPIIIDTPVDLAAANALAGHS
jgi:hypothetical protein